MGRQALRFDVRFNGHYSLGFNIWNTHAEYREATQYMWWGKPRKDDIAFYQPFGWGYGVFGRIYTSVDWLDAGLLAHEVTHFLHHWMRVKGIPAAGKQEERCASFADRCYREVQRRVHQRHPFFKL